MARASERSPLRLVITPTAAQSPRRASSTESNQSSRRECIPMEPPSAACQVPSASLTGVGALAAAATAATSASSCGPTTGGHASPLTARSEGSAGGSSASRPVIWKSP
jgi:hypothetical protein